MAEAKVVELDPQAEGAAPKGPGKGLMIGALAGAVVVGLGLGAAVLGPRFAGGSTPAAKEETHAEGSGSEELMADAEGGKGGSALKLENIVVNPTGSEGVHFLMASVVIDIQNKELLDYLRSHKHIVEDTVLETLGSHTMEWLSRPTARKEMKANLTRDVGKLVGDPSIVTVYLPGFVVQ